MAESVMVHVPAAHGKRVGLPSRGDSPLDRAGTPSLSCLESFMVSISEFQRRLLNSSQHHGDHGQRGPTCAHGGVGVADVTNEKLMCFRHYNTETKNTDTINNMSLSLKRLSLKQSALY